MGNRIDTGAKKNFSARKDWATTYGYFSLPPELQHEDVNWWMAITDAPPDVLAYTYFLRSKYDNLGDAFEAIDGGGGGTKDQQLNLQEFEKAYHRMECQKFKGPNEMERLANVFHYLDPSGEREVSLTEFFVMNLLWKEVILSIKEFVLFCQRMWGEDLAETWDLLDKKASGTGMIRYEEWDKTLRTVGYFGPAKPIFDYLDDDDGGTISLDEFQTLEKFKTDGSKLI